MTKEQHTELMRQMARLSRGLRDIRDCLEPLADLAERVIEGVDTPTGGENEK